MNIRITFFVFLLVFLVGCSNESNNGDDTMAVQEGNVVSVHYTGTLDDGSVFDSSEGRAPLEFTVGAGSVIKGFDDGVLGLNVGESRKVSIEPVDAYGEVDLSLVREAALDTLPEGLEVGSMLAAQGGAQALVKGIEGDKATLDFNHPLAGKRLHFDIEVVSIKEN